VRCNARSRSLAFLTAAAVGSGTLLALAGGGPALAVTGTPTAPAGGAGGATAPTTTYVPAAATPTPPIGKTATGAAPRQAKSQGSGKISTGAVIAAAVAALLALGCAAWGVARLRAYEPHSALSASHAMAEAGFRASSTWDEFKDWVRLGR
jgi:hypothetical protein